MVLRNKKCSDFLKSKHFEEEKYLILRLLLIIGRRKPLILLCFSLSSVRTLAPNRRAIYFAQRVSVLGAKVPVMRTQALQIEKSICPSGIEIGMQTRCGHSRGGCLW